jgi:hypothetical protein
MTDADKDAVFGKDLCVYQSRLITTAPDFNDLTPPHDMARAWDRTNSGYARAARWGARHGYEQARQLWPEPITDRPPTEADGDGEGLVQYLRHDGCWGLRTAKTAADRESPWLHTSRWQPRQPTLKEQALEALGSRPHRGLYVSMIDGNKWDLIRRALEQAGEGVK